MTNTNSMNYILENMPLAAFFYELLLLTYPKKYRQEYAQEMRQLFYDLYEEKRNQKGGVAFGFWIRLIWDIFVSTIDQHWQLGQKIGARKYFSEIWGFNKFFIVSLILIVPFLSLTLINFGTQFLVGRYNFFQSLYQNPFWLPFIGIIAIILPTFVIFLNLYLLVTDSRNTKQKLKPYFWNYLIMFLAFIPFVLLFGHDIVPCTIFEIKQHGILNLFDELNYCRLNA